MDEYTRDFVQESEENITRLNNSLLDLERSPDDREAMDEVFRMAHTLKGNCGTMGYDDAQDLAHAIEDRLDDIRAGRLEVTPELMDEIFDAVDELEAMVDEIRRHGEPQSEPSETIDRLHSLAPEDVLTPPNDSEIGTAIDAASSPDDDHNVYFVRLDIESSGTVNNGRRVVDALVDAFDLLGTVPGQETIDAGEYGGEIDAVFGAPVTEEAISNALEPVDAVQDFVIVEVTDRARGTAGGDRPGEAAVDTDADGDRSAATAGVESVEDVSVDDLLNEFDDYDDLDEMVEHVRDAEGFDELGDHGTFDDVEVELDVDAPDPLADVEEKEPRSAVDAAETETAESADSEAAEPPTDGTGEETTGEDEVVDDASETFKQLKQEVDPVGFDELQDELDDLEFDQYDQEDEVGFHELLDEDELEDDEFDPFGGSVEAEADTAPADDSSPGKPTVDQAEATSESQIESVDPEALIEEETEPEPDEPEGPQEAEAGDAAPDEILEESGTGMDFETGAGSASGEGSAESPDDAATPGGAGAAEPPDGEEGDAFADELFGTPDAEVSTDAAEGASAESDPEPTEGDAEPAEGEAVEPAGAADEPTTGEPESIETEGLADSAAEIREEPDDLTAETEPGDADAAAESEAVEPGSDAVAADSAEAEPEPEAVDGTPEAVDAGRSIEAGAEASETEAIEELEPVEVTEPAPEPEAIEGPETVEELEPEPEPEAVEEPEPAPETTEEAEATSSATQFEPDIEFDTGEEVTFEEDYDDFEDAAASGSVPEPSSPEAEREAESDVPSAAATDAATAPDDESGLSATDDLSPDVDLGTEADVSEMTPSEESPEPGRSTEAVDTDAATDPTEPAEGTEAADSGGEPAASEEAFQETVDADLDAVDFENVEATVEFGPARPTEAGPGDESTGEESAASDEELDGVEVAEFEVDEEEAPSVGDIDVDDLTAEIEAADEAFDDLDLEASDAEPDFDALDREFGTGTTTEPGPGSDAEVGSAAGDEVDDRPGPGSLPVEVASDPEELPDRDVDLDELLPTPPGDVTEAEGEAEDETQSVRVDIDRVDELLNLVEGLVTTRARLRRAVESGESLAAIDQEIDDLEDLVGELQDTVMDVRLMPLSTVANRLPRTVRDIARDQDKRVSFEMEGGDVEIDRSILDDIDDPLMHLVRNAVDHGIEPPEERETADKDPEGTVVLRARRQRDQVVIEVEDDGRGLDPDRLREEAVEQGFLSREAAEELSDEEIYDLVFEPGFSTTEDVSDVSGRGVGMDVVSTTVGSVGGAVSIESEPGEGTIVSMTLPVTVAISDVLFVRSGEEEFGVPLKAVEEIGGMERVEMVDGEECLVDGEDAYPILRLAETLETRGATRNDEGKLVQLRQDVREIAIHCDEVRGQQEVVVRPFEGVLGDIPGLSGATVLGEGDVVNILDVNTL
jgi:two-component system chemotaxis sensor kinase CheA